MMRLLLLCLCGLVCLGRSAPQSPTTKQSPTIAEEWRLFKADHGKNYKSDAEDDLRLKIYLEKKQEIESHNEKFKQGLVSYTRGINKFSDMTTRELDAYKGLRAPEGDELPSHVLTASTEPLPPSVDWRTKGVVTGVKDQGGCGSCWTFSATGALEGQWAIKTGKLLSLSEQQLVDCITDMGCWGGWPAWAFTYVTDAGGIENEKSYPYQAKSGHCRFNATKAVAKATGYVRLYEKSEEALKRAVATVGPVSVCINIQNDAFFDYHSGVFDNPNCHNDAKHMSHAVLAVGYGTTEDGIDFWLVKNSWSVKWGDKGYVKMSRNKNNQCGIATIPTYPTV